MGKQHRNYIQRADFLCVCPGRCLDCRGNYVTEHYCYTRYKVFSIFGLDSAKVTRP